MQSDNYTLLVNRTHRLTSEFVPHPLLEPAVPFYAPLGDRKRLLEKQAAKAVEQLFANSLHSGLHLYGISGYRPFERQKELFEKDTSSIYVAPPGASEHQTGLALDVSCPDADMDLTEDFAHTREGKWLAGNAALYGFILRYPKNKTAITGYAWEPWHIRYVTKTLALYLTLTGLTLEEYYKHTAIVPSDVP